jgi:hypothetical protein
MHAVLALALLLAQAEPAPVPEPPAQTPPPPDDNRTLSAFVGGSYLVASGGAELGPSAGISFGGGFEYRYLRLAPPEGPALLLGASLGFFYDRFNNLTSQQELDGYLTQTGFVLCQTAAVPLSAVTPWIALGGGITVAYFSDPGTSARQPVLTGALGLDVALTQEAGLRIRLNLTRTFTHRDLFGDLIDGDVGVFYRF